MDKRSLAEILLDLNLITSKELLEIESQKKNNPGKSLEVLLLELKILTELELVKAKAILHQIPWVDLQEVKINPQVISLIPEKIACRHICLPLEVQEGELYIAIANPYNIFAFDEVQMLTGKMVIPRLAMPSQILEFIEHYYHMDHHVTHQVIQQLEEEVKQSVEEEESELMQIDQAPIIRLANHIIHQGIQNRASDIHIEPSREETQVRYRIDGVLSVFQKLSRKLHPPLLSRFKIMANLDISQRFLPQDGSISYMFGQTLIDLRISIIQTIYGEKIVLRILNQNTQIISLEELGFWGDDLEIYKNLLNHNHGIILITGPTGSGKSTTLSSSIKTIISHGINISTVEDPVEYRINQVNQIQVNEKTGLTFSKALRSLLRQDPDVLMIGEIRDEETANIAIRAALTGHLVLSSLHTNDAISTITRLSNMNIPEYLISSSLIGVVAQRLVRRICPECIEETSITKNERIFLQFKKIKEPEKLFIGKGCSKCNQSGYYGRIGIFEILRIDDDLRTKIAKNPYIDILYQHQYLKSKTLIDDAMHKVKQGLITMNEIIRVIA
ncbi:MAG: type II/IV secretion system protein [Halanaerobiales bacterium]|nr:type II/IV secretion system protein [Halanaerobiales bacterium]